MRLLWKYVTQITKKSKETRQAVVSNVVLAHPYVGTKPSFLCFRPTKLCRFYSLTTGL